MTIGLPCDTQLPVAEMDARLESLNVELSTLFRRPPARLILGAGQALDDELVICGLLGGKDVGKSSLINALAGATVSHDTEEIGFGTEQPIAYLHRRSVEACRRRMTAAGHGVDLRVHDLEGLANIVLLDLPDFDSDLHDHRRVVEALAPRLDRVIWVMTPRKIADRDWVSLASEVFKDRANVHCVLNKTDELLSDTEFLDGLPDDFLAAQRRWAAGMLERCGWTPPAERLYLLCAAAPGEEAFVEFVADRWGDPQWRRFSADRPAVGRIGAELSAQLDRLRAAVLTSVTPSEERGIKQANRRLELEKNVSRLRAHHQLEDWRRRLDDAVAGDWRAEMLGRQFGSDYVPIVARRLRGGQRPDVELADEVLSARMDAWPLLPVVFWSLRWLVRRVGAGMAGRAAGDPSTTQDLYTVHGRGLEDRVRLYRACMETDHAGVIRQFGLSDELPEPVELCRNLTRRAASVVQDMDDEIVEGLTAELSRPSLMQRAGLWLILLWFPLLQPLALGFLQLAGGAEGRGWNLVAGAFHLVTALSAAHLLAGLTVVGLVYFVILAVMFARCIRAVRRRRRQAAGGVEADPAEAVAARLEALILEELAEPLHRPLMDIHVRLTDLDARLALLASPHSPG